MATPSILIVPDRYKSGVLYSQLPESGAVDFDVTRATTAFRTNASGVLESVASGVPRLDYPAAGGCPSLLIEPAATNIALHSRNLTDAAWVKTDVTADKNAIGADGVASGATTLTASAASGTVLQTVTATSAQRTFSAYVRRVTGTGTIQMTMDNGTTWTAITLTSAYQAVRIPSVTNSNPVIGFRILTSGDAIAVDFTQLEAGAVATSPIPTTSATVTRNAEVISKSGVSGFIGQTEGTIYAEVDLRNTSSGKRVFLLSDGTANNEIRVTFSVSNVGDIQLAIRLSGVLIVNSFSPTNVYSSGVFKISAAYKNADYALYVNGLQVLTSNVVGSIPACNRIDIGSQLGTSNFFNDRIRAAAIYTTRLSNTELAALTTL